MGGTSWVSLGAGETSPLRGVKEGKLTLLYEDTQDSHSFQKMVLGRVKE